MLQQDEPDDYVIAHRRDALGAGVLRARVRPRRHAGRLARRGAAEQGVGEDGRVLVEVDRRYFRPTEVEHLLGDPTKARTELGWTTHTGFEGLVTMMVEADLAEVDREVRCGAPRP